MTLSEHDQMALYELVKTGYDEDCAGFVMAKLLEKHPERRPGTTMELLRHWCKKVASNYRKNQWLGARRYVLCGEGGQGSHRLDSSVGAVQLRLAEANEDLAQVHPALVRDAMGLASGLPSGTLKSKKHRLRKRLGVGPFAG